MVTFEVYLRSDMSLGTLIMTYSRPLLLATYEVYLACGKTFFDFHGNRTQDLAIMIHLPQPLDQDANPNCVCNTHKTQFFIV